MNSHKTFGGSSAYRWLACPGSVRECAKRPPQAESPAMLEGTHAHALHELALKEGVRDVLSFVGEKLIERAVPFTLEDVEAVQTSISHFYSVLDGDPNAQLYVERQFEVLPDVGGTVDVAIYLPSTRTLVVGDYKHGRGHYVDVEGNPQPMLYALGALQNIEGLDIHRVDVTIAQPRCPEGAPIRTAVYSVGELVDFYMRVASAVEDARAPDAPLVPGEEQCHWCPAAADCPALVSVCEKLSVADPAGLGHTTITLPPVDRMRNDPQALADTLVAARLVEEWIDAVRAHAEAFALSGGTLPDHKLVWKRPSRKWINEEEAQKWLLQSFPLDTVAPRALRSVASIEPLVRALGKNTLAKFAELVDKKSSGLKLVHADDPGEPVNAAVALAGLVPLPPEDLLHKRN